MSIWFCLFLTILVILLLGKIMVMKIAIKEIQFALANIIKSDTNSLITISTNSKDLKNLAKCFNQHLKTLRKLEIEYQNGNQELKRSITNISHDLRTPLTAIRGYLDLIDDNHLTNEQRKYFNIIHLKIKDLTNLTEQLFDFSKSLDISNPIHKIDVCVNTILEETIGSFYSLFKKSHIEPIIEICNKKIIKKLDETMLKRILENIISNAIKYSEEEFLIQLKENGEILFSNKTTKMDSTSLEKIFDRYYTVENTKKSNGIGLSIAKQLVELNGGEIKASYQNHKVTILIHF